MTETPGRVNRLDDMAKRMEKIGQTCLMLVAFVVLVVIFSGIQTWALILVVIGLGLVVRANLRRIDRKYALRAKEAR